MFGYATDETEEAMPLTLVLAHRLNARLHELRRNGTLAWARPDSKSQVRRFYCLCASGRHLDALFLEIGANGNKHDCTRHKNCATKIDERVLGDNRVRLREGRVRAEARSHDRHLDATYVSGRSER